MIKRMLPVGASLLIGLLFKTDRQHPKEYMATRGDINKKITLKVQNW